MHRAFVFAFWVYRICLIDGCCLLADFILLSERVRRLCPSFRRGMRIKHVCVVCALVDVCAHGCMIVVCCWLLIARVPVLVLTFGWCVVACVCVYVCVCVHDDSSWLQVSPQLRSMVAV